MLRVGLVGCGGRGTGAALQALRAEDGTVVLTAVADMFADRIESSLSGLRQALGEEQAGRIQVSPEHTFVGFDACAKLIASDVDVVLLATPPHFRPAQLSAAIAADKHVFCEKPMAVDAPGVRSVMETVEEARRRRLSLVSGFCWRYNVRHRALFERLHAGALGRVQTVYTTYNASPIYTNPRKGTWSDMEWQLRNWHHFHWLSGDSIVEQACHSLDKMAWAMNDVPPLSCVAVGGRQARRGPESGNVFDHFAVTYEYADGVKGFHMSRQMENCAFENNDYITGERGIATINGWAPLHTIAGPEPWTYEGEGNDMYQQEHDELFAAIRADQPRNDGDWMARSTLLSIMGRMASYTGRVITWDEALASNERLGPAEYALGALDVDPVAVPGRTEFV